MPPELSSDEKFIMMTQKPVEQLITSLATPTVVSMLITSIYNMADTFFVSRISTSASGAVGIAFSLMTIIQAIGFTFGTGAGNYIARLLGRKNRAYAKKVAATGFFTAFGLGVLLTLLGLIYLEPLVYALGATDTIAPYAADYLRYLLIGAPCMISAFVLSHLLRFQGSAYYAMIGIGVGGFFNVLLDPLLIFTCGMGISGAALATIISQFISFLLLLRNSGRDGNIKLKLRHFSPTVNIYQEIFRNGAPTFYRHGLASTAMICLNFGAGSFGDAAVAAMSIVARIFQFAISAVLGFCQGFQPVCGFNYGAGRFDRVLRSFWFSVKTVTFVLVPLAVLGFYFAPGTIALFRKEDLEVITIGARALRLQSLVLPLSAWIIPTTLFLQTINRNGRASLLALARQGLFFLPAIFLLPRYFGVGGVQASQPLADLITFFLSIVVTAGALRKLGLKQRKKGAPAVTGLGKESPVG